MSLNDEIGCVSIRVASDYTASPRDDLREALESPDAANEWDGGFPQVPSNKPLRGGVRDSGNKPAPAEAAFSFRCLLYPSATVLQNLNRMAAHGRVQRKVG
jgi:hypothetical protein